MKKMSLSSLEKKINYVFKEQEHLVKSLTHKSYSHDKYDNERLEFLGDSILNLSITTELYKVYPNLDEGVLTRIRSKLVCEDQLHKIANSLELSNYLLIGPGEKKAGGNRRVSTLADAVEAIIAAVYIDSGNDFNVARSVVMKMFVGKIDPDNIVETRDNKTLLQEYTQCNFKTLPTYELKGTKGSKHNPAFEVEVTVNLNNKIYTHNAVAVSIKKAEQLAAKNILIEIKNDK